MVTAGTVTVSGTAEPGATVEVRLDGEVVATTTADEDGNWSVEIEVEEGPHSIEAKNGSASDIVDIEALPDSGGDGLMIALSSPAEGDTTSSLPTIVGTATAGATIEVFIDDASVGTTVADENDDWTFTLAEEDALEDGAHTVSATATLDEDSVDSELVNFTVDSALNEDDVELMLVGGCSSSGGAPVGGASWLLAALGLFLFRSRRRDLEEKRSQKKVA